MVVPKLRRVLFLGSNDARNRTYQGTSKVCGGQSFRGSSGFRGGGCITGCWSRTRSIRTPLRGACCVPDSADVDSQIPSETGTGQPYRSSGLHERVNVEQRSVAVALSHEHQFQPPMPATFGLGERVRKKSGAAWQGHIVGWYSTKLTPEGYAVESEAHPGSVQIYPVAALERVA